MAQATLHQLSTKPRDKAALVDKWSEDNQAGRSAAEEAVSACIRQESPMEIVSTIRRMITTGKLSGFEIGYITAIAESAISDEVG